MTQTNIQYILKNEAVFDTHYKNDYGVQYPDSNIVNIYEIIFKNILKYNPFNKNLLDFGCGNGTHSQYFQEEGFNVFGIDISSEAIALCRSAFNSKHFYHANILEESVNLYLSQGTGIFHEKMDVIFANHVLYLFNKTDLTTILDKFNSALNNDGLVIFTMATEQCYWFQHSIQTADGFLRQVKPHGRSKEDTYMHFSKDIAELKKLFHMFKYLYGGKYDFNFFVEGSTEHLFFIGKKRHQ